MQTDAILRTPPPDFGDITVAADWWAPLNDIEAWEKVMLECKAEKERSREDGR